MGMLKSVLKSNPQVYLAARTLAHRMSGQVEAELGVLPFLVDPGRGAIDVGANTGVYIQALRRLAQRVIAYEANPALAGDLTRMFPRAGGGGVTIVNAAVSNAPGTLTLRAPRDESGLATVAAENPLLGVEGVETFQVPAVRLDDQELANVGFLKVDIEGHELAALEGAQALIGRERPTILVEAEERHRPNAVASIRAFLEPLGYRGLMIDGGRLTRIESFDLARDQAIAPEHLAALNAGRFGGRYINNFIFVP